MAVIAVFNQKGGVGKTTTALNLCAGLAQLNLAPLGIDLDPQGHLTLGCGVSSRVRGSRARALSSGRTRRSSARCRPCPRACA